MKEALMEDKKANIIAVSSIIALIIFIVVAYFCLGLSKTFDLIAGADVAAILSILAFIFIRYRFNRRKRLLESQLVSEGRELRIEYSFLRKVAGVPIKFRVKEIEEATDGFKSLLGRGSSASVFKGVLADGTHVAVKRIEGDEKAEKEFRSEVSVIASVQHVNLVHLLGYSCVPSGPRFLVYDFAPNGSLDKWIFARNGKLLSWDLRFGVAMDVARALSYLHSDCRSKILHLDVKPENILLDENFRALVSDFGLSKLMRKDESRVVTKIRGTKGYLAPEWVLGCGVSEKSDVYSYGIVLLEIIGGKRNASVIEHRNGDPKTRFKQFSEIARDKLREGKLMEVVDHRIGKSGGIDEREIRRLVCVALWCIQDKAKLRPSMARVVEMLEGLMPVEEPPESHMVIVDPLAIDHKVPKLGHHRPKIDKLDSPTEEDSSNLYPFTSTNSFTMSILSAR